MLAADDRNAAVSIGIEPFAVEITRETDAARRLLVDDTSGLLAMIERHTS